jgi:hypothetical protein
MLQQDLSNSQSLEKDLVERLTPVKKPSIFVCKTCKSNTVEIEKKPKQFKEKSEILQVKLEPSKQKDSKYSVKIEGGKTVNFGQNGASDYLINKDKDRRARYITRH